MFVLWFHCRGLLREEIIESGSNVNNNLVAATYNGDVEYYVACYAYQSAEIGDLVFDTGEVIAVTKKEGDWWTGNIGNRTGIFPSNYVQKQESVSTALETSSEPSVVVSEKQVIMSVTLRTVHRSYYKSPSPLHTLSRRQSTEISKSAATISSSRQRQRNRTRSKTPPSESNRRRIRTRRTPGIRRKRTPRCPRSTPSHR